MVFVAALAFAGCGDGPQTNDLGQPDTGGGDDVIVATQTVTFVKPDPASRPIVSGTYTAEFRYDDSSDLPASLTVSMVRNKTFQPIVLGVDGSGVYTVDIDTTALLEGNESIQVTAVSQDERQVTAKGKILVDNKAPLVEILDPTPVADSNFIGGLKIRVRVTDEGNKVRGVGISINGFEWNWPSKEGEAADVVDTRTVSGDTFEDLEVPIAGWLGGPMVLTVTADDGIEGHEVVVNHPMTFVEVPGFVGGENVALPSGVTATSIAGIRIGPAASGVWGVLTASNGELAVYQRESFGVARPLATVIDDDCPEFVVADMTNDDMDDIVAYCGVAETRRIVLMEQVEGSVFEELVSVPLEVDVIKMTVNRLNSDAYPDIAFTNDHELTSTGIILSQVDEFGDLDTWGAARLYSGAIKPESIAIGKFNRNANNNVVVGRKGSGMVTVFPVSPDGVATIGENSTLKPEVIDDVAALAAVNFASIDAVPDALIALDSTNVGLFSVAGLVTESSRVESRKEWATGLTPNDMAIGDIDGNNVIDVAVLCPGANMVQIFLGNASFSGYDYVKAGLALLAGAARDLALADMDDDGMMDVVLLNREGTAFIVIYYREQEDGRRFLGSYQALLDDIPMSLATGHFTQPLSGDKADFVDAAVLYPPLLNKNRIGVYASNSVVGMPIEAAGSIDAGFGTAKKLVTGNFNVHLYQGSTDPATRPDDLLVTTTEIESPDDHPTSAVMLFNETGHLKVSASLRPLVAGDAPAIAAVADFDELSTVGYDIMDIAFIYRIDGENPWWVMQPWLGKMDGTFKTTTASGNIIEPMMIEDERNPVRVIAYPMRRSLVNYVQGKAGTVDLIVANSGAGDFTVFLSKGVGMFLPKDEGSRDFAVGGNPIDIKAGYLRSPIDGTAPTDDGINNYPDVVTLLDDNIVISYSLDKDGLREIDRDIGFEPPVAVPFPGQAPVAIELADMNGDAWVDIVVLDTDNSSVWVYVNLANRRFSEPYTFDTGTTPIDMSVTDVDADGCPDIVTADQTGRTLTNLWNTTSACRK